MTKMCHPASSSKMCQGLMYPGLMYPAMRQKRSQPDTTAALQDLHVPSHFVEALAQEQDAGTNFYGQAIYPAAKRARRCQARSCKPFVHCFQGTDRQMTLSDAVKHVTKSKHACADPLPALPEPLFPSHILGYLGSSLRGSRDLDSDVVGRNGGLALPFSKEEDRYDHNLKTGSTHASRLRLISMSDLQAFPPAISCRINKPC